MQAVFMVGEQRSGSNLLRVILNSSDRIAAPHPPHVLQRMMPLQTHYGDLQVEQNFMQLVDDVCRLIELNPVPWEGIHLDRNDVRSRCLENSVVAVFGAVMDCYAELHDASAWMCKSMQNIRWATDLNNYFSNSKYIYLYRDPRDVALSFSKAVIGDKHPYFVARQWAELQSQCLEQRDLLGEKRFFSLCYEDLITEPEEIVRSICDFLEVDYKQEMLAFHKSKEAVRSAGSSQLWENLSQPMIKSNTNKFLRDMPEDDVRIVESVAGPQMDQLGYRRLFVDKGQEERFSELELQAFAEMNERQKQQTEKSVDPEDIRRRQDQLRLLESIKLGFEQRPMTKFSVA